MEREYTCIQKKSRHREIKRRNLLILLRWGGSRCWLRLVPGLMVQLGLVAPGSSRGWGWSADDCCVAWGRGGRGWAAAEATERGKLNGLTRETLELETLVATIWQRVQRRPLFQRWSWWVDELQVCEEHEVQQPEAHTGENTTAKIHEYHKRAPHCNYRLKHRLPLSRPKETTVVANKPD